MRPDRQGPKVWDRHTLVGPMNERNVKLPTIPRATR